MKFDHSSSSGPTESASKFNALRRVQYTALLLHSAHQLSAASSLLIKTSRRLTSDLQLQKLIGYLIQVQEEERRRMARDLHDDIGQRLALLKVELEMALMENPLSGNEGRTTPYQAILSQLDELSIDVQQLSHTLHSSKLRYLGLKAAMKELCERIQRQQRITVNLEATDIGGSLEEETELCIYRVAQEALHNVIKHSGADLVVVKLLKTKVVFGMEIRDNGKGFHYVRKAEGLGLASMRERLKMVGGNLQVNSELGCGTILVAVAPFRRRL